MVRFCYTPKEVVSSRVQRVTLLSDFSRNEIDYRMANILFSFPFPSGIRLHLVEGDITTERVDAIVNAANDRLVHGGGVAGAIVRRGGNSIQQESNDWVRLHGPLLRGRAAVTAAGALPCQAVIHVAGPVWGEGDEDSKLRDAVRAALETAADRRYISIAMPAISTGIFGFPKERGARVIFGAIEEWARSMEETTLREIRVTILDDLTQEIFLKECRNRWPS
jgi:O-acetyl-ADP-ribose deacetylase